MNRDASNMFYPWERRSMKKQKSDAKLVVSVVLISLFVVALALDVLVATPKVNLIETAHAEEVVEIHQNDYYCQQWRQASVSVIGASSEDVDELCKKWGA